MGAGRSPSIDPVAHVQHPSAPAPRRVAWPVVAVIVLCLVLGTAFLHLTFRVGYDTALFYRFSLVLGACWVAVGIAGRALGDGLTGAERAPLGRAVGIGAVGGFAVGVVSIIGAWVLSLVPWTADLIVSVLGPIGAENFTPVFITAVLVGAAEELAFRGGVFALFRRRPVLWSTVLYAIVTCATINPALVVATVVVGVPFAWLRARTGRVAAAVTAHVVWTTVTLSVLSVIV